MCGHSIVIVRPRTVLAQPKLTLLLAVIVAASMWFYVEKVLIPYQVEDAAQHGRPRGVLSDLYPRWLGARELLLSHRDPYSDAVTRDIQTGYYGRVIDPTRPDDPKDEQRFAYPVYVTFLLAPLVKLPFAAVRVFCEWTLALATAVGLLLWLWVLRWRPSAAAMAVVFLLALDSMPVIQGIKLQQLTLLVAAFIALGAALVSSGELFLAGIFLGMATIKPQLAALPVCWLAIWTLGRWRERQGLAWGFLATMVVFVGAGEYLLPGWFHEFLAGMVAYQHYTGGVSQLGLLLTPLGGALLTMLAIVAALVVSWKCRRVAPDSQAFAVAFAFVLALAALIVATVAPYNQILLLPAVLVIIRDWERIWMKSRLARLICIVAAALVVWPWIASTALMVGSAFITPTSLQHAWAVPLWTSLGIPIAILPLIFFVVADNFRGKGQQPAALSGAIATGPDFAGLR